MKTIITVLTTCLIALGTYNVNAQVKIKVHSDSPSEGLYVISDMDGKNYGYGEYDSRRDLYVEIIPLKYDRAWNFINDRGLVEINDKRGFVDKTGAEVIPIKYDWAGSFNEEIEGAAAVKMNDKAGFIDKYGEEVIPLKFDHIGKFEGEIAVVKINKKYGFIDKSGRVVVPLKYDDIGRFYYNDVATVEQNGKHGYIDRSGKVVVPIKYDEIDEFGEQIDGLAKVQVGEYMVNEKYGFVNKNGKEVIPVIYDKIVDAGNGLTIVYLNKKAGLIDYSGKTLFSPKYDWIDNFRIEFEPEYEWEYENPTYKNIDVAFVELNDKYGLIDKTGKELVAPKFSWHGNFSEGLCKVALNDKFGFINKAGEIVIPCIYDRVFWTSDFNNGRARASIDGKKFYIDKTGKPIEVKKSVDTVFADYIEAIGGEEAVKAVNSLSMMGGTEMQGMKLNVEIKQTNTQSLFNLSMGGNSLQKMVFNGETGYQMVQGQKIENTAEQNADAKKNSKIFPELTPEGATLEKIGNFAGQDVYVVKINDKTTAFYDITTALKLGSETKVEAMGQTMTQTLTYGNYKEVKGVKFPFNNELSVGPQQIEFIFTDVKVNEGVSDADFQ